MCVFSIRKVLDINSKSFLLNRKSSFSYSIKNTLHTNLLHKFGTEQINGKPKKKVKVIANY